MPTTGRCSCRRKPSSNELMVDVEEGSGAGARSIRSSLVHLQEHAAFPFSRYRNVCGGAEQSPAMLQHRADRCCEAGRRTAIRRLPIELVAAEDGLPPLSLQQRPSGTAVVPTTEPAAR